MLVLKYIIVPDVLSLATKELLNYGWLGPTTTEFVIHRKSSHNCENSRGTNTQVGAWILAHMLNVSDLALYFMRPAISNSIVMYLYSSLWFFYQRGSTARLDSPELPVPRWHFLVLLNFENNATWCESTIRHQLTEHIVVLFAEFYQSVGLCRICAAVVLCDRIKQTWDFLLNTYSFLWTFSGPIPAKWAAVLQP